MCDVKHECKMLIIVVLGFIIYAPASKVTCKRKIHYKSISIENNNELS